MNIIQIGDTDWTQDLSLEEGVTWYYSHPDQLARHLASWQEAIAHSKKDDQTKKKSRLRFDGVLLTSSLSEGVLAPLTQLVGAHHVFYMEGVTVCDQLPQGFCHQKMLTPLPHLESREAVGAYLTKNLFKGQYGAKLKIHEMDIYPGFTGKVSYQGNVGVSFEGDFGADYQTLFTFRYNLPSFSMSLELWPEYYKKGECQLRMEIIGMWEGSLGDIHHIRYIEEEELSQPYILQGTREVGYYSISIQAKGVGQLTCGAVHWRYSREGLGRFVLGGKRHADSKGQEVFSYFNPGDCRPPLTVYFSGFRPAEGFEGYTMMASLGTPFVLIADPRLEGGCFYTGSKELEEGVCGAIQEALDYLGFSREQLILSGLSMGAFGAVYYAAHFKPYAVIAGKPFTNLGDTVSFLKLKRPDEFETCMDMMRNVVGSAQPEAIEDFNQHFWQTFAPVQFERTQFALAYMEHDDYDVRAFERLLAHLSASGGHLVAKGYEGRHNDESVAIVAWFLSQYRRFLQEDFERGTP